MTKSDFKLFFHLIRCCSKNNQGHKGTHHVCRTLSIRNLTHCNLPCILASHWTERCREDQKESRNKKQHIPQTKNLKWGANPTTLRSSTLALCYSAAGYACPMWERSTHAKKLDATLNETCRMITGYLKPTV